jgi:F-type H+-transporting ATPase subunit b
LLAEADAQAADILSDGRARIDAEVAELEARAAADAASMGDRLGDELRAQIVSLSAEVTQRLLAETLDDAAQQQMIEGFIQKVGSSS